MGKVAEKIRSNSALSPKQRARWAERNKNLENFLNLEEKTRSDQTEDTGSLWEKDVDAAYERLHKDEKKSLKKEGPFREEVLGIIYPERK
jgi:hypothetical protein